MMRIIIIVVVVAFLAIKLRESNLHMGNKSKKKIETIWY